MTKTGTKTMSDPAARPAAAARLSGPGASASRANSVPPPPPKTGCGVEPVGALGRTARGLKAGFALVFFALVTLAALAPQTAQAQSITLTAKPGNGKVDLSWTWSGITGQIRWQYRVFGAATTTGTATAPTHTLSGLTNGQIYDIEMRALRPGGIHIATSNRVRVVPNDLVIVSATGLDSKILVRWDYQGSQVGSHWEHQTFEGTGGGPWKQLADYSAARSGTIENLVNGRTYNIAIRYLSGGGGSHADSVLHNVGWVSATPRAETPTLTSDPNKAVTVESAEATTNVCFNLLSVKQVRGSDNLIWLQQRTGGNSYINRLANLEGNNRVEITQAPAGITTGLGVNLFPCATLGVGTHTVTWSWKGRDGTAVAATTSTTVTVTESAPAPKTITLSASPSATITEGDSGSTDVTITFTLSEPAPANFSVTMGYAVDIGTAAASGKGVNPCDPPLIPRDTDVCLPDGVIVSIAEGQTQGTKIVRILGDTRDEPDETINLTGYHDDWANGALTLTITDDDEGAAKPARPKGLSAEAGNAQVVLTWTDPGNDSITRYQVQQRKGSAAWGSWTAISGSDADTTNHTVTGLDNDSEYRFRIRARNGSGNSAQSAVVSATPTANPAPSKPVLTAVAGDRSVTLSWTAQTNIASWGYQYKSGGGNWSSTTTVSDGSATSTTVTGLTSGTEYTFRLFARRGSGASAVQSVWSDEVTATPDALSAPVLTGATSNVLNYDHGVQLTWTHSGDLLPSGATWNHWQMGYRLRGSANWQEYGRTSSAAVRSARTVSWLGGGYPEGAVVEVRVRGRGFNGNGLWSNIRTVTLSDDDDDRPALTITGAPVTVAPGSTATYTVALTQAFAGTLSVASNDTSAATVSPPSLTFTAGNYNTAQAVTVTGVGNGTATINHAFRLTGASADAIPDAGTVDVTVADAPGVTVSTTLLRVVEGDSGTYTLRLNRAPSSDVTITVTGASGDVTVTGSPLTFTTSDWSMPQTVTVSAGTDADTMTDLNVTLNHSASGGGYDSVGIPSVLVSVVEKDAPPAKPTGLAAAAGDGSVTLSWTDPDNPTITKWQYRQKAGGGAWGAWTDIAGADITSHELSGLENGTAYQFEVRAVNGAGPGAGPDAPVTATPRPPSYIPRRGRATVTPTALTVAEGDSGSYALVLDVRPSREVTVAISGASGDVSVSPSQLVFTRSNWNESQTVTVTAAEDDDAETDPPVTLSHEASGGNYGAVSIDDVEVTVTENDTRGATLSTAALSVPEGGSAEYAATLDSQPSGEVTVAISGASGDVSVSPSRLVFTRSNWNEPQSVTVSAAEDDDAEADAAIRLSHAASGGGYGSVSISDVEVTVTENDARGATLSTAELTVPEGGSAEYAATLDSQPSGEVTVEVSGASGDVTVSPSRLVFTGANWNESQTVTVSAAEDDDADPEPTVTLSHSASGGGYGAVAVGAVTVTVTENDAKGATLSTDALTVPEGGSAEYALALDSQPSGEVTVAISGASGDVSASPSRLIFTGANWNEPQTVTVSAAEDDDADPDPAITLSHSVSGGGYDAVAIGAVAVTVTENDTRGATLSKDALTVPEAGSGAYALMLDSQPSGEVTVEVSGASGDVTVSPSRLIFTGANWNEAQTVTVSAARDDDALADPAVTLSHSAAGGGYDAVAIGSVRVSVTENYSAAREAARKRDAVNRAVLPQVLAALGSSSAVKERVEAGGISGASGGSSAATRFGAFLQSFAGRGNGPMPGAGAFPAGPGADLRAWTADPRAAARSGLGRGGWLFAGPAAGSGPGASGSNPGGPLGSGSVGPGGWSSDGPAGSVPSGAAGGSRSAASRLGESLFNGAGFALPLAAGGGSDLASTATVWGRGEQTSFAGSEAGARWDGRLWTAHLGADFRARPDVLVGAAVSHSRSETDVGVGFESVYETELTSLSPYAAWLLADGSNLWASASYGAGEARVALRDAASRAANLPASPSADLTMARAEAGGRRVLAALPDWIAGGVTRFSVKGEGSLSRATTGAELGLGELTVDASRLRLALEGSHERTLAGGGVLTPAVEAGLRYDGGDVVAGAGLEIGASLGWRDPGAGLTAEFRGRALATHERDRDEWGLSALLRIDPAADGLGGFLTLAPSWGATETGIARLFDAAPASAFANGGAPLPPRARMEAEYGYGFGVARRGALAVLSPYARLGLGEAGERSLRFGAKYLLESAFSFEFELERREDELLAPAQWFMLRGEYRW